VWDESETIRGGTDRFSWGGEKEMSLVFEFPWRRCQNIRETEVNRFIRYFEKEIFKYPFIRGEDSMK